MIQSALVSTLGSMHIYGSFCCDNSLSSDCSLTRPTADTTDLKISGSHFHLNEQKRLKFMNFHPRHTLNDAWSPEFGSRLPPLLQRCWKRHLVSTGAKLYFYSCPPAHGAAFDTRSSRTDNVMMKASAARRFPPFSTRFKSRWKICLSKHRTLRSKICALMQIISISVVVSSVLTIAFMRCAILKFCSWILIRWRTWLLLCTCLTRSVNQSVCLCL